MINTLKTIGQFDTNKENIGKIEIRFTNCIPALRYHKIGKKVFISSKMIGNEYTLDTIVHEYEETINNNDAFHFYDEFFNNLWKRQKLSWYDKKLSINSSGDLPIDPNCTIIPDLVIGDVIIDRVMKMTCNELVMILRTVQGAKIRQGEQPVRAFFTIINCTDKDNDGVIRRYNVHAVDRQTPGAPDLDSINTPPGGEPLGYPVNIHHAIGKAVISGKTVFRTINPDFEPSDPHTHDHDWGKAVVSLSVPINAKIEGDGIQISYQSDRKDNNNEYIIHKDGHTRTIATLTFEFNDATQSLFHIPPDKKDKVEYDIDIKEDSNRRIKEAGKKCAELIIDYLGLNASAGEYQAVPKDIPKDIPSEGRIKEVKPNTIKNNNNPSFLGFIKKIFRLG